MLNTSVGSYQTVSPLLAPLVKRRYTYIYIYISFLYPQYLNPSSGTWELSKCILNEYIDTMGNGREIEM